MTMPEKELATLRLAAEGLLNKQIADRRGVGLGTVKGQIVSAIHRLGARNRIHAVAIAAKRGLI